MIGLTNTFNLEKPNPTVEAFSSLRPVIRKLPSKRTGHAPTILPTWPEKMGKMINV